MTTPADPDALTRAPRAVQRLLTAHLMPITLDRVRAGAIPVDRAIALIVDAIGDHSVDQCSTCQQAQP